MPLEATMILLDNSDYSLDGDYTPTRWVAQTDAANIIFTAKTNSNPESVVGLMVSAGRSPEVLVTPTTDGGKIAAALHGVARQGQSDLFTSINIAQLALKHRQNKNQRQRIIAFVASPLLQSTSSKDALVKLGKKMKKNNVAIDVVSIGETAENQEALEALIGAVNSSDNSHLLTVPASKEILLSDVVMSSDLLSEDRSGMPGMDQSSGGPSASGGDGEFGVDPNLDPELAMALRMSLEDERARQAASQQAQAPTSEETAAPSTTEADVSMTVEDSVNVSQETSAAVGQPSGPYTSGSMDLDDDEELAQALALSRGDGADGVNDFGEVDDEEEEIRKAIALSLQAEHEDSGHGGGEKSTEHETTDK